MELFSSWLSQPLSQAPATVFFGSGMLLMSLGRNRLRHPSFSALPPDSPYRPNAKSRSTKLPDHNIIYDR